MQMTDEELIQSEQSEIILKPNKQYEMAVRIKEGEAGKFLYCLEEDRFYYYTEGYWQQLFEYDFLGKIQEALPELTKITIQGRKSIAENFKILGRHKLELFNRIDLINLQNGMLSPYTGEIDEHDYIYFSTNRLPYKYDPSGGCDLWLKSLNEILEGNKDKTSILQEFFGYCLTKETKQNKALLLLGESKSGKSTILYVLRFLIGDINCSSVPLKDIRNPQHTPDLINKLINFDYDVSAKAIEFEDEFKKITSGEPIRTNQKYVAAFSFTPYCKMAMAANIFPKITDHSSAFYNRLILIPCDRVFSPEEQDRDLKEKLLLELPGILNWSMEGLKRLTTRGRFEDCGFMQDAVQELEDENNPVNMFFEEHIIVDMGRYIEKGYLYDKYKIWGEQTRNFALSKARFASCLWKKYYRQTSKTARIRAGKRIWPNIQYVEFKSDPLPEVIDEEVKEIKIQDEITWGQEGTEEGTDDAVADGVNEGQG